MFSHWNAHGRSTEAYSDHICLPHSNCEICGNYTTHPFLVFPSIKFPPRFAKKNLSFISHTKTRIVDVSRLDFERLAGEFKKYNPKIPQVLPGTWVGPIKLKTAGRLRDVIWAGVIPFFSKRLVDTVMANGVILHPDPVALKKKGQRVGGYYYCRPALVELWDTETLLRFNNRCQICGQISGRKGVSSVEANHGRVYRKSAWPKDEGIVYSTEHMDELFSDQFVEVCQRENFDGLAFERVGKWV